jgi:hypothetical protein
MAIRIGTHFSRKGGLLEEFILESRNEVAMRGIESYLPEGDVASIWGAAHLRGIGKSLKRAGFREVRREWFTAYHDRPYSLLECLKWGEISVSTAKTVTALKKD